MSRLACSLVFGLTLSAAVSAQAQHAVPRFEPAPAGDRFFGVGSADVPGRLTFHAGLVFDYAHRPFVFKDTDSGDVVSSLIEHTLLMHAQASLALWDRLELSLSLPVALSQSGDDPVYHGERTNSPSGGGLGDLRVGVRVRLFGLRGAAFQLGLGGYLWLPTGSEKELLSDGKVRGAPLLNASGRVKRFIWASQAGVELRSAMTLYGAHEGSMLRLGGAGGVLVGKRERGQLGAELSGQLVLRDPSSLTSGVELLASGKWRFVKDFELGAAVGPGLLGGIGTPSVRALASLMYTPQQTDQTAKKPKPVADQDGDGVPDDADACPRDAGPAQSDAGTPGCPAPVLAPLAVAPAAPAPVDSDGDGVSDDNDACPNEAGTATATRPGCPEPAPVPEPAPQPTSETLPERLKFALGNASVTPAQAGSIDKVRERMQQNPSKKLRIEGHSDDLGALDYNQQLSEQRAESAKAALMRAGIPAERLETRGFGPTRPLVQGTSPEARAQNRRVEFVLHD